MTTLLLLLLPFLLLLLPPFLVLLLYVAAWGGHLELTALSAVLQRPIRVHAVGMDTINIGENLFLKFEVLGWTVLRLGTVSDFLTRTADWSSLEQLQFTAT